MKSYAKYICIAFLSFVLKSNESYAVSQTVRLLSVNVGNQSLFCLGYKYKLCQQEVEDRLREQIELIRPDIVSFQELLSPEQCINSSSTICQGLQARRLLGSEYTISCESRSKHECVAVRTVYGSILGCEDGNLCFENPAGRSDVTASGCDPGFSAYGVQITWGPRGFTFVNAHLQTIKDECRREALGQIFAGNLGPTDRILIAGDMNFDPSFDDKSTRLWNEYVGESKHYQNLTTLDGPVVTADIFAGYQVHLDHVISNYLKGKCYVLGETPGTWRLDGGSGTDHRAIVCDLQI